MSGSRQVILPPVAGEVQALHELREVMAHLKASRVCAAVEFEEIDTRTTSSRGSVLMALGRLVSSNEVVVGLNRDGRLTYEMREAA